MKKTLLILKAILLLILLNVNNVNAQCTASFGFTLNAGGNVDFASTSTGTSASTTYQYFFGDNSFANINPANHTYSANGVYTVMLFMYEPGPPSCSATAVQTIQVTTATCAINAGFTYTNGANGLVNFQSTSTGTTASTSYTWAYGDNTTGSGINPSHTYSANGTYMVKLSADNGNNCADTSIQFINITNVPCNLTASFNFTQMANGGVMFNSTSSVVTQNATTYDWKNNGVTFANGPWASSTFTNGTYTITLVVTNTAYVPTCADSVSQVITVTSNTCNLSASFSFTQGVNGVVQFASTSTGTTAGMNYFWNFGDSFTATGGPNQTHTYTAAGTHTVSLMVFDPNNTTCVDTTSIVININTIPCTANANFTVVPTSTVSNGLWYAIPAYPWNVVAATWSWGDATSTNSLYAMHQYSPTGLYNICLTVTVSCGATASTCANYMITKMANPQSMAMAQINVIPPPLISLGISTNSVEKFSSLTIYPNPSNDYFNIEIVNLMDNLNSIQVYNITGALVTETPGNTAGHNLNSQFETKNLSNGVYFIKLNFAGGTVTKKLIVNH